MTGVYSEFRIKTTDFHQTPVGKWHRLNSALRNLALELTIIIFMFFKVLLHLLSYQMSSAIRVGQAPYCSFIWWSWDSEKFKWLAQHEIEILPRFPWWLTHKFENVILTTFVEIQRIIQRQNHLSMGPGMGSLDVVVCRCDWSIYLSGLK